MGGLHKSPSPVPLFTREITLVFFLSVDCSVYDFDDDDDDDDGGDRDKEDDDESNNDDESDYDEEEDA